MYFPETALKVFLSEIFFFSCRKLPFCFRPAPFACGRTVFQTKQTYEGMKNWQFSEAAVLRCSFKYFFLKNFQNSQKNTCAGASLLMQLQVQGQQLYLKK